ncbi:Pentatricopeptide repeat-containing protein, chloroplastic [Symbiodinium microadriaticum]|uniref:Pentatricopeptide repeat-containing protein, chloroplastic n=1 Tax=Symbiodinium microadriaticum TaxID=2951 RepID=A0A1Q9CT95_SYMMI|nr:Pentatricopeptide repeat-containing protein, chloroplastic [Symbiodinium microadriaticum]
MLKAGSAAGRHYDAIHARLQCSSMRSSSQRATQWVPIRDMAGEGHVEVNLADEERVGSATPGCINFRSRWAAAAAAAATALLFVGALQAKSAFSSPIVASIGTKTAINEAEFPNWEEIPGMDQIVREAQSLRPPRALRNLSDLFYSSRPQELGWVRTECVIDTIQATAYLGQAIVFLYKAIDYQSIKTPLRCYDFSPSGCAASVAGFVTSITWVATYLSFAANACAQAVNSDAICVGDFLALMANFGEIASAGAAVKDDCKPGLRSNLDLITNRPRVTHDWAQFIPAAAAPTAGLIVAIKHNRTLSRNRAFDITQCVMDVTNMLSFIVRALLQVRVAAASCPQPRACAMDIMNVISTFMWISRFTALAITDCSVGGSRKALCAADITNMVAAVSNGPAAGIATTSDCADVTVSDELKDVVARSGDPDLVSALTPELPDQHLAKLPQCGFWAEIRDYVFAKAVRTKATVCFWQNLGSATSVVFLRTATMRLQAMHVLDLHGRGRASGFQRHDVRTQARQTWQDASRLLGDASAPGRLKSVNSLINACGKAQHWALALAVLGSLPAWRLHPDIFSFGAAISACKRVQQWGHAVRLLVNLEAEGLQGDAITHSSAMAACEKASEWTAALLLFSDLTAKTIEGDVITYNTAISACEKGLQWPQALQVLVELERSQLQPTLITFTSVISAFEKGDQWHLALDFFTRLESARMQGDVIAYSSAIAACEKGGQWSLALLFFSKMYQERISSNIITFNSTMSALGTGGEWQRALALFTELSQQKLQADAITYNAAMRACEEGGEWAIALSLLETLEAQELQSTVVTYNTAISLCQDADQWPMALHLLGKMTEKELQADVITYSAAINACEKGHEWQMALALLAEIPHRSIQGNVITYSSAMSACEKGGEWTWALHLLSDFYRSGLEANVITYNVVLFACAKGEQWQQALYFLSELTSAGLQSTVLTFNAAMAACTSHGFWQQALSLLSSLLHRGMQGDVITFSTALNACASGQQRRRAVPLMAELQDRAWKAGCEVAKSLQFLSLFPAAGVTWHDGVKGFMLLTADGRHWLTAPHVLAAPAVLGVQHFVLGVPRSYSGPEQEQEEDQEQENEQKPEVFHMKYGTFKERERSSRLGSWHVLEDGYRRREAGDEDEFPWLMMILFLLTLGAYAFVMYGCWDTSQRIEVLATRSENALMVTATVSNAMGGLVTSTAKQGEEAQRSAIYAGLDQILNESENAMLEEEYSKLLVCLELVMLLYAESERLSLALAGMQYAAQSFAAKSFLDSVDVLISVLEPLTAALPKVDKEAMESLSNSTKELQRLFSEMELAVQSIQSFLEVLATEYETFRHAVAASSLACALMFHGFRSKLPAPSPIYIGFFGVYGHDYAVSKPNQTDAVNLSKFVESAHFQSLVALNLVRDYASLGAEEQKAVLEAVSSVVGSARTVVHEARRSKAILGSWFQAVSHLVTSVFKEQFALVATSALVAGTDAKDALNYAASMYLYAAGAGHAAFRGGAFACYLEYIFENQGIARVYEIAAKVHVVGFYLLIFLQDAVARQVLVSILLVVASDGDVLVALFLCVVGNVQLGLQIGCEFAPMLSDNAIAKALGR